MSQQPRDPTLEEVIRAATDRAAEDLRVAMPGRIESYDASTHLATVKPLLKARYRGRPAATDLPAIHRVPVVHPRTAAGAVLLPVAKGDIVLLVFSDRALDNWIPGNGGEKEPRSHRKHDLSDAYAIPGGYPAGKPLKPKFPGALELRLNSGAKIAITNGDVELLDLMHQVLDVLAHAVTGFMLAGFDAHTHSSSGAGPPNTPLDPTFGQQIRDVQALLSQLKA